MSGELVYVGVTHLELTITRAVVSVVVHEVDALLDAFTVSKLVFGHHYRIVV